MEEPKTDQFRVILAIVLSIGVFFIYFKFFAPEQAPPTDQTQQTEQGTNTTEQPDSTTPQIIISPDASATEIETPAVPIRDARKITVNTQLYSVIISEEGGKFLSFVLADYNETMDTDSSFKELISPDNTNGTLGLSFIDKSIPGLENAFFASESKYDSIDAYDREERLVFTHVTDDGIIIERVYVFSPDSYLIDLTINLKNNSNKRIDDSLALAITNRKPENTSRFGSEGPVFFADNKITEVAFKKIAEKPYHTGKIEWLSFQDRYFMTTIIPVNINNTKIHITEGKDDSLVTTKYIQPKSAIDPGIGYTYNYKLFFGPKKVTILQELGFNLNRAVDFGWFDIIAKPCLWLLNFFYKFIPNYGVCIILLTIIMKLLLFPLGQKSYKSMNAMKKLQPLMTEIREKYKGDKKRMNQETMSLYKTYKINPVGGCLPMVAQIPVFFAFYRMLYGAIELRHAPFMLWITDLSAPDRLFHFSFNPFNLMTDPGLPLLTLMMGATQFLQQKMTPTAGDPQQAKMMMMMPVFMTFIFINFSSGLVLYWFVSNLFSIIQQYYTQRTAK